MNARIIPFRGSKAQDPAGSGGEPVQQGSGSVGRCAWKGVSGRRYEHTIYTLLECPELPSANVLLARHSGEGRRTVLSVFRVCHAAPSLNRAEVRRRGALLGANEVHVHIPASLQEAKLIEIDLRTRQLGIPVIFPFSRSRH